MTYPPVYPIEGNAGRLAEQDGVIQPDPRIPGFGVVPCRCGYARKSAEPRLGLF